MLVQATRALVACRKESVPGKDLRFGNRRAESAITR
jgi:hypothetical protein